ncbi:hypothetical protein BJ999_005536 [Actinomadura citrea]|uniref:Uncharacterized protein n=1 Tax=Actinomadura citrea TaxID=46158 RepID=A0A7Y9GEZ2_9ACTN|nr:hypothetical protein [Actinomadura citrea]
MACGANAGSHRPLCNRARANFARADIPLTSSWRAYRATLCRFPADSSTCLDRSDRSGFTRRVIQAFRWCGLHADIGVMDAWGACATRRFSRPGSAATDVLDAAPWCRHSSAFRVIWSSGPGGHG